jgi:hypothetical protein
MVFHNSCKTAAHIRSLKQQRNRKLNFSNVQTTKVPLKFKTKDLNKNDQNFAKDKD